MQKAEDEQSFERAFQEQRIVISSDTDFGTLLATRPSGAMAPTGQSVRRGPSGSAEAAWREAQAGGCSNDLWLELAAKCAKDHAEDALPIYQRQIEPTLDRKNNEAYAEAVGFLQKVRELMVRLGREIEFTSYLDKVRAAHKAKRNFMKLLDRTRF
jgi:hypothetical protein